MVVVFAPLRIEARAEPLRFLLCGRNGNSLVNQCVHRALQRPQRLCLQFFFGDIEADNLPERMYARIRATGADRLYLTTVQQR